MDASSYDQIPYTSLAFPQTHPDHLAGIARLFALRPPDITACRVLELGCASGGNLLPMAFNLPGSEFVGIDLSQKQVDDGRHMIAALGVRNVRIEPASIADVDEGWGQFDYIICHGVFSWVERDVQDHILTIASRNLSPNGIAYVSYNTYPGWHMRGMIRDMMRYHAMRFSNPQQRVQQSRALLDFLNQSVRQEGPYSALLKSELESIKNQADHYLYHEHLEEVNDPVYFHQFVAMARKHGLRYLGESRIGTMVTGNFGPEVQKTLKALSADQIQTEQYMDFIRNRMFRETLLVPEKTVPNWTINPDSIRKLHLASSGKPSGDGEPDIQTDTTVQYQTRSGMTLSTNRPLLKAAMQVLRMRWPGTIPFEELRREARTLLGGSPDDSKLAEEDAKSLAVNLTNTYISSDLIELHAAPILFTRTISEKPAALPSARARVLAGGKGVANRRHELVKLSDLDLRLLPLLDGTRTHGELIDRLTEKAVAGDLRVARDGKPITDRSELHAALTAVLDHALKHLAGQSLLIG